MCFSLSGRFQTRLVSLSGPCVLALVFSILTAKPDYLIAFGIMAVVGLILETGLYGWLIDYQPRWLSIALAGVEFLILKWIMEWPYPFEIRLHTRQALEFYSLSWLAMWLIQQALLPILWPRWTEDGGEFGKAASSPGRLRRTDVNFQARRKIYWSALLMLSLALLPWGLAWRFQASGQHFTGLLFMESFHLNDLAQATRVARGDDWHSVIGVVGWIARLGHWPVLLVYQLVWLISSFAWWVGLQINFRNLNRSFVALFGVGVLPLVLFPASGLILVTLFAWLAILIPLEWIKRLPSLHRLVNSSIITGWLVWGLLWLHLPAASMASLSEAEWQAIAWLNQSEPVESLIAAPRPLADWIPALAGQLSATTQPPQAQLEIRLDGRCQTLMTIFRHDGLCIVRRN